MSETATMTLTQFLTQRLDEDEVNARSIQNAEWFHGVDSDVEPEVLAFSDPARVLAEVEAKRRIVSRCDLLIRGLEVGSFSEAEAGHARDILAALALPYRTHPDYDPTWAPTEQERP